MVTVHDIMSRQRWVDRFPGAMGDSLGEETSYSLGGENSGSRIESVVEALRKVADVERQLHENKGCNKVDLLNITFDERRWKKEALLTVQVANLLTSLWRAAEDNGYPVAANDALLYHYVRSIVLFSPSVFGSVICFDNNLYKNYTRFCPYAFRDSDLNGSVHVFDIANGDYDYTTDPNAIWWHKPKNKALTFKPAKSSSMYEERFNATAKKAKNSVTAFFFSVKRRDFRNILAQISHSTEGRVLKKTPPVLYSEVSLHSLAYCILCLNDHIKFTPSK